MELLTTYGFMIALAGLIIVILFYFATPSTQILPSSCSSYGSLSCYRIVFDSNTLAKNANVLIYLSNSGSSPANVISANLILDGITGMTFSGPCTTNLEYPNGNTFVVPGSNTICFITVSPSQNTGSRVEGEFKILLDSCNSGVSQFNSNSCSFIPANVTGTFLAYSTEYVIPTTTAQKPTVTLSFSSGNSIVKGASDIVTGASSAPNDGVNIKYCNTGSCSPATILATGIGSASYNLDTFSTGTYTMESCDTTASICSGYNVLVVSSPPPITVSLTFSAGNSITQGTSDIATGTTSATGDSVSIEDCSGSGCTPSTVLASGTTSATYNVGSLAAGTYTMDACDTTASACSADNVVVISSIQYVPITLTNTKSIASRSPFQEELEVPTSLYSSYINSQWSNVEFTTGPAATGSTLQAWIENNAVNTASNTLVWVNLPNGIAASSTNTIYMDFMPSPVLSASGPTGEAPTLSSSYGQYDNGGLVFNLYSDFSGTSLPSSWNSVGTGYTVNDGLSFSGASTSLVSTVSAYPIYYVLDAQLSVTTANAGGVIFAVDSNGNQYTNTGAWLTIGSGAGNFYSGEFFDLRSPYSGTASDGSYSNIASTGVSTGSYMLEETTPTTSSYFYVNYKEVGSSSTDVPSLSTNYYVTIGSGGGVFTVTWIRLRTHPPDGVMPTATYGSVS